MKISSQFNRFLHGAVFNEMKKVDVLKVRLPNHAVYLPIKTLQHNMRIFKWWLKQLNLDYPRTDNGEPYSTRTITTKQTMQHIEWCIMVMGENGLVFPFVAEEWERLKENYKGY